MTRIGIEIEGEASFDQWSECGQFLNRAVGAVQWWIGDWMNYGERRYGDKYAKAIEATGLDYHTVRVIRKVTARFESDRRRSLSFAHHAEVASLPPKKADAILARAEAYGLSTREVRQLAKQVKNAITVGAETENCCTVEDLNVLITRGMTFGTIYADPPWSYDNQGTRAATGNHYGTMTVDELAELPVEKLAMPQSHLWLWTTNAFLFDCPRLFDAWGFEFKSSYVWVKPQMGIGNYLRNSHELLLLAVRGGLTGAARDVMSWGEFDRTEHSAKPEKIRSKVIEPLSPGPRLELFGRRVAPGWVVWGNQVSRTMFDTAVEAIE